MDRSRRRTLSGVLWLTWCHNELASVRWCRSDAAMGTNYQPPGTLYLNTCTHCAQLWAALGWQIAPWNIVCARWCACERPSRHFTSYYRYMFGHVTIKDMARADQCFLYWGLIMTVLCQPQASYTVTVSYCTSVISHSFQHRMHVLHATIRITSIYDIHRQLQRVFVVKKNEADYVCSMCPIETRRMG